MSLRIEHLPLVGLLLPLLTVVALLSTTGDGTTTHLLVALVAGMAALAAGSGVVPLRSRTASVRHRSEVCRATGVRSSAPDRRGVRARPRAPGLG